MCINVEVYNNEIELSLLWIIHALLSCECELAFLRYAGFSHSPVFG